MDPRLLRYYNDELGYLRRRAREFGENHAQVAGRLGLNTPNDPDPHVERLLEGVAFLNARVQLKLDQQFPEFTQYLLDALYPHYLAPTPAMVVLAFEPREGDESLAAGVCHPRGTRVLATAADGAAVELRTGQDVTLLPIRVAHAAYLPTRAAAAPYAAALGVRAEAALTVRIEVTAPLELSALTLDRLVVHLDGAEDVPNLLFEQLLADCVGALVAAPDAGAKPKWTARSALPEARGFAPGEALLPGDARAFRGYRLLAEYFAMPERFRFVALAGLGVGVARAGAAVDLVYLFGRAIPALATAVSADNVRLFATPAINLWERPFDRALVDRRQHEHLVLADRGRLLDYEVHSLTSVTAYARGEAEGQPVTPAYARRVGRGERPIFYTLRRSLRRLSEREASARREPDYVGSQTWISLSAPGAPGAIERIEELGLRGLVTNRGMVLRLRVGGEPRLALDDARGVARLRILRGPSRPRPPLGLTDAAWRVVSHLAPGHRGFTRPDGAPDLLQDHLALYLRDESAVARREIQGITSLDSETVTRRAPGEARLAFRRGQALTIGLATAAFEAGTAYLFSSVVARFLAESASVNSFAGVEARLDNGTRWGWDACPGSRPTI